MAKSLVGEKSFAFALQIIALYRKLNAECEFVLSKQLLRSGTSIGANVEEASAAQSRADFIAKQIVDHDFQSMLDDAEELVRLLTSIVKSTAQATPNNSKLKTQN